jgi:hypothetical protein
VRHPYRIIVHNHLASNRMIALTKEKLHIIEKKSQLLRRMHKDVAKMLGNPQTSAEKACPVARGLAQAPSGRKS